MDSHEPAATWALVPLKAPQRAKSRLAGRLGPAERERLFFALAEHVIGVLRAATDIDHVVIVTASAVIADFAHALHVDALLQVADAGMSVALEAAAEELAPHRSARVLMVPGDLPLISPGALRMFFAAAGPAPGIALVPDRHRIGTNLLLCTPPRVITPCFGTDSCARHLRAAAAAGVPACVLQIAELALDLDEPGDLEYLQAHHGASLASLQTRYASRAAPASVMS